MPVIASNVKKKRKVKKVEDAKFRPLIVPLVIIAVVTFLDQFTKSLVVNSLAEGETVSVIGSFFQLRLIYNSGGALGTSVGTSDFYLGTSIVILLVIFYLVYHNRSFPMIAWPLSLCAAGAVGNILDRVHTGKVVDFLDFDFFDFNFFGQRVERWWTFNIADSSITVGIILLMAYILFFSRKAPEEESVESSENSSSAPLSNPE